MSDSHIKNLENQTKSSICLIKWQDEKGRKVFAYVNVPKSSRKEMEKMMSLKRIDLQEYGEVIKAGYGTPSPYLQNKIKEEYIIDA